MQIAFPIHYGHSPSTSPGSCTPSRAGVASSALAFVACAACAATSGSAPDIAITQPIPLRWEMQCIDGDFEVVCDRDFDNMTIDVAREAVTLTNGRDPTFQEGEYRNAFVLSQPLTIPEAPGEVLVVKGRMETERVEGTTGIWVHLASIFDEKGALTGDGFAGGAQGFSLTGSFSSFFVRGWAYQQVDGWYPKLSCMGFPEISDKDLLELRITRSTTWFLVNGDLVDECETNYVDPEIVIQLWLDNYDIGFSFSVDYGDVRNAQIARFRDISASYARVVRAP